MGDFILFLQGIPGVGPVIVNVLKYVGAVAAFATALSVAVGAILKIPEIATRWAGATKTAEKIHAFYVKIKPWLDYLSIFNAKKK